MAIINVSNESISVMAREYGDYTCTATYGDGDANLTFALYDKIYSNRTYIP